MVSWHYDIADIKELYIADGDGILCHADKPVRVTLCELDRIVLTAFCHESEHRFSVEDQKLFSHTGLLFVEIYYKCYQRKLSWMVIKVMKSW